MSRGGKGRGGGSRLLDGYYMCCLATKGEQELSRKFEFLEIRNNNLITLANVIYDLMLINFIDTYHVEIQMLERQST